jgi:hypothetical protein
MKANSLHAKRLGELAEELFTFIAGSLGLIVCKPETQLSRYDFIVDCTGIPGLARRRVRVRTARVGAGVSPVLQRGAKRRSRSIAPNPPLLRVQVKCTTYRQPLRTRRNPNNPNSTRITLSRGAWRINLTCQSGHVPYRRHDFDLLAALVLPEDPRGSSQGARLTHNAIAIRFGWRPRPERQPEVATFLADDRRPKTPHRNLVPDPRLSPSPSPANPPLA